MIDENVVEVTIRDPEDLNEFDPLFSFDDVLDRAHEHPVLILQPVDNMTVEYMQGIANGVYFYA